VDLVNNSQHEASLDVNISATTALEQVIDVGVRENAEAHDGSCSATVVRKREHCQPREIR
jgi:hypothetical protein